MREIRWGIIGCGNVCEVKSGPAFNKSNQSRLVAVMRRQERLAKDYAQRHGVPEWYDDADELINDPEVDAVYIATPPAFHKDYTLRVAQARKPVYVEKPMALNSAQCREMIAACEQAGVKLFVAYYRRALPRFLKVKELLEVQTIGAVRFVNVCFYTRAYDKDFSRKKRGWRLEPEISGGGYFFDQACHTIDLLQFLLGPIDRARGFAANQGQLYKADDTVTAAFNFASGVQGMGMWCHAAWGSFDGVEIVGTKGKICFSTFENEPVRVITDTGTEEHRIDNPPHVQQPLIQSVVNELLGKGQCPSTGETAALTNRVMDEILTG